MGVCQRLAHVSSLRPIHPPLSPQAKKKLEKLERQALGWGGFDDALKPQQVRPAHAPCGTLPRPAACGLIFTTSEVTATLAGILPPQASPLMRTPLAPTASAWALPAHPPCPSAPIQVTVILKHMFSPEEFIENPLAKEELEGDVRSECAKLGKVDKVGAGAGVGTTTRHWLQAERQSMRIAAACTCRCAQGLRTAARKACTLRVAWPSLRSRPLMHTARRPLPLCPAAARVLGPPGGRGVCQVHRAGKWGGGGWRQGTAGQAAGQGRLRRLRRLRSRAGRSSA